MCRGNESSCVKGHLVWRHTKGWMTSLRWPATGNRQMASANPWDAQDEDVSDCCPRRWHRMQLEIEVQTNTSKNIHIHREKNTLITLSIQRHAMSPHWLLKAAIRNLNLSVQLTLFLWLSLSEMTKPSVCLSVSINALDIEYAAWGRIFSGTLNQSINWEGNVSNWKPWLHTTICECDCDCEYHSEWGGDPMLTPQLDLLMGKCIYSNIYTYEYIIHISIYSIWRRINVSRRLYNIQQRIAMLFLRRHLAHSVNWQFSRFVCGGMRWVDVAMGRGFRHFNRPTDKSIEFNCWTICH